jgi:hypothetical protein
MWRVAALTVRNQDVSAETFNEQMLGSLAPAIAAAVGDDTRLRRLIANRRPDDLDPQVASVFPPLFDGLLEFWFESAEDAAPVMNGLSRNADVKAAAEGLVDGKAGVAWLAEVFPTKLDTGGTRVKFLAAGGDVAAGWTVEDAQAYWRDVHPVVARTCPKVWGPMTRYTQFHGRKASGVEMGDWLADFRFVQARDFIAHYTSDEYLAVVRPDEEKFCRPGEMLAFVSGEERDLIEPR